MIIVKRAPDGRYSAEVRYGVAGFAMLLGADIDRLLARAWREFGALPALIYPAYRP